jgi:hypothetical protein
MGPQVAACSGLRAFRAFPVSVMCDLNRHSEAIMPPCFHN